MQFYQPLKKPQTSPTSPATPEPTPAPAPAENRQAQPGTAPAFQSPAFTSPQASPAPEPQASPAPQAAQANHEPPQATPIPQTPEPGKINASIPRPQQSQAPNQSPSPKPKPPKKSHTNTKAPKKRGPGRPPNPKKITITPDQPLSKPDWENFAKLIASGKTQEQAYQMTRKRRIKRNSASARGSALAQRPEVRARIQFLTVERETGENQPQKDENQAIFLKNANPLNAKSRASAPSHPETGNNLTDEAPITREELIRQLSGIVRSSGLTATDRNSAIKNLMALEAIEARGADAPPDPATLCAHLARYAGMTAEQVIQEQGGLDLITSKLCQVLHITPDHLLDHMLASRNARVMANK